MEQQIKYYDRKKILDNKVKISATIPRYIYDDVESYSNLTGIKITDIVTSALFEFFGNKILTNDYLLGYGDLYFNLPLDKEFKDNAIANKIKLNQEREPAEMTEPILIKTITNNLDKFNGSSYSASGGDGNIIHTGIDFKIIHSNNLLSEMAKIPLTDVALSDFLFVFYYEVSNTNSIDVYLINPMDAVNKLSSVNHILGSVLIGCLQEMEVLQNEIKEQYRPEIQGVKDGHNPNRNYKILNDVLKELSTKYDNPNIIYGSDLLKHNTVKLADIIDQLQAEHEINKRIIKHQNEND